MISYKAVSTAISIGLQNAIFLNYCEFLETINLIISLIKHLLYNFYNYMYIVLI